MPKIFVCALAPSPPVMDLSTCIQCTKNTSDYEQEPPRTLVPLQIGWSEFDLL